MKVSGGQRSLVWSDHYPHLLLSIGHYIGQTVALEQPVCKNSISILPEFNFGLITETQ